MAKEKFLIIATRMPDDCFSRFSESENRANLDAGTADETDAYSWIEASYEIQLVRHREATHICSFTPSAYYVWLQNAFVGIPNAEWDHDGDPDGLELESGGEYNGYGTYEDDYSPAFICDSFTIDTVKDLGLRKPRKDGRGFNNSDAAEAYHSAIWKLAEEAALDIKCNGLWCDALDVYAFRQRERAKRAAHYVQGDIRSEAAI